MLSDTIGQEINEIFAKGIHTEIEDNISLAVQGDSLAQVHSYQDKGKTFFVLQTRNVVIEKDEENKEYRHNIKVEQCIEFSTKTFVLLLSAMARFADTNMKKKGETHE